MVGNSPRRGELRLQSYGLRTSLSPSQLARPWQMNLGFKGWGQFARTALHLKTPQRRPQEPSTFHDQPPYPVPPPTSKVLQRWARGESGRWKMSLEAVVSNLHVGGSGHSTSCAMVALLSNPEATTTLGSTLSDQAALFRESTACSTWRGAVEKVRLNKARLHSTQLASRGQWASS